MAEKLSSVCVYIFRSAQISVSKSVVASNFFNAKTANCAVFLSNAFPLYRANYQRRRQISSTTTLKPRITTIFYLPIIFVKKSTAFHQWDTFIYLTVQSERKVRDFRGSNNYVRYRTRSTYFDDKLPLAKSWSNEPWIRTSGLEIDDRCDTTRMKKKREENKTNSR